MGNDSNLEKALKVSALSSTSGSGSGSGSGNGSLKSRAHGIHLLSKLEQATAALSCLGVSCDRSIPESQLKVLGSLGGLRYCTGVDLFSEAAPHLRGQSLSHRNQIRDGPWRFHAGSFGCGTHDRGVDSAGVGLAVDFGILDAGRAAF